jgi:hypothetical protein
MAKVTYFVCDVCGNKIDTVSDSHGIFTLEKHLPFEGEYPPLARVDPCCTFDLCNNCLDEITELVEDLVNQKKGNQ